MAQKYRVLEVKLKSANLSTEKIAKRYAVLSIRPNLQIQTKPVLCHRSNTVWNEKFVFLVSQSFLNDNNSSVTVELYRKRKFFGDALIGKSVCSLGLLVAQESETGSDSEEVVEKKKLPAMKGSAKVAVTKNGLEVKGNLNVELAVWEGDISVVGDSQDFAMRYNEFLGQNGNFCVKMEKSWTCIAPIQDVN